MSKTNNNNRLSRALSISVGYNAAAKKEFKLAALQCLRRIAAALSLPRGSYDIRYNAGGIAVSGEATLHHEKFYLQISQPAIVSLGPGLLRTCKGRRDYTGGPNNFLSAAQLDDTSRAIWAIRSIAGALTALEERGAV